VEFHHAFGNGESDAEAAVCPRCASRSLGKQFEYLLLSDAFDADAIVLNLDKHRVRDAVSRIRRLDAHAHPDVAADCGVLCSVRQQIAEGLTQPHMIGTDRELLVEAGDRQLMLARFNVMPDCRQRIERNVVERCVAELDGELSVLQARGV
jgi:hypothetical protein